MCCDVGLVSEFRLTASCVLMDLASPTTSQAAVYANGLTYCVDKHYFGYKETPLRDGCTAESSKSSSTQFKTVTFVMIHSKGKNSEQTFPLRCSAVCT